jgi:multidrug efflux system membrane fusion protein
MSLLKMVSGTLIATCCASAALAQMGPSAVLVERVQKQAVEWSTPLVGQIEPVTRTRIAAEQEGILAERFFDEGRLVEKNAVLTRVNVDLLQVQRQATVSSINASKGLAREAKARAENAAAEQRRIRELSETGSATDIELRNANTEAEVTAAMLSVREAELSQQEAELARFDLLIQKAETRAPVTGVIARRHVEVGQWIRQGDAIADLVQLHPLHVAVNVPEGLIAQLKRGDELEVTIDALAGRVVTATVDQLLPEADQLSRSFPVRLLIDNENLEIRPGFFARVTIESKAGESGFVVSRDAVITSGGRSHVVVVRNATAVIVPVRANPIPGGKMSVEGELTAEDLVVVRGNESLAPGMPVMVMNPPTTAPSQQGGR